MSSEQEGRRALVTGGAGFIGGHLVAGLLAAGWSVRVIDDLSSGFESNLADTLGRIDFIRGDIRDTKALTDGMNGVEVVFHHAAIASVPRSISQPYLTNSVNLDGTLQVLEAARSTGVRRVVFAASSAAYGNGEETPKVETLPTTPESPYALQKYAGEMYCRFFHEFQGLETVALRYFNIFGPRQDPESDYAAVIPRFISAALSDQRPVIYGDGLQTRDFLYVENVVEANLKAADAQPALGSVINIGTGTRTSLNDLWSEIREIVGTDLEPRYEAERLGDVRDSMADISRAQNLLGYEPSVGLHEGLRRTIKGFGS
jgi:UDP-glucose 4-epimerase